MSKFFRNITESEEDRITRLSNELAEVTLSGDIARMTKLIEEKGISIERSSEKRPLIFIAIDAKQNSADSIKLLLKHGASVNSYFNFISATALEHSLRINNLEAISALLSHNRNNESEKNRIDVKNLNMKILLEKALDNYRVTEDNHLKAVKLLLDYGVSPDYKDPRNDTIYSPLLYCARYDKPLIAKLLLDTGAKVDISSGGTTPLLESIYNGNSNLVKLFLEYGASVNKVKSTSAINFASIFGGSRVDRQEGPKTALQISFEALRRFSNRQRFSDKASLKGAEENVDTIILYKLLGQEGGSVDWSEISEADTLREETVALLSLILPDGDLKGLAVQKHNEGKNSTNRRNPKNTAQDQDLTIFNPVNNGKFCRLLALKDQLNSIGGNKKELVDDVVCNILRNYAGIRQKEVPSLKAIISNKLMNQNEFDMAEAFENEGIKNSVKSGLLEGVISHSLTTRLANELPEAVNLIEEFLIKERRIPQLPNTNTSAEDAIPLSGEKEVGSR